MTQNIINNVMSIHADVLYEGFDNVNANHKGEKYTNVKFGFMEPCNHDNIKYAKKVRYMDYDANGNETHSFGYKVSSECQKFHAFHDDANNPNVLLDEDINYQHKALKTTLVTGYMDPSRSHVVLKRKSGFCLSDAFEVHLCGNNWQKTKRHHIDFDVHNGNLGGLVFNKKTQTIETDKQNYHYEETFGETNYIAKLSIWPNDIAFINTDIFSGDISIDPEGGRFKDTYLKTLSELNNGDVESRYGWYHLKGHPMGENVPINGILLDNVEVDILIKHIFESISDIWISKTSAQMKFVKFLNVTVNLSDKTVLKLGDLTYSDISSYQFLYDARYVMLSDDDSKKMYTQHKQLLKEYKKNAKKANNDDSGENQV